MAKKVTLKPGERLGLKPVKGMTPEHAAMLAKEAGFGSKEKIKKMAKKSPKDKPHSFSPIGSGAIAGKHCMTCSKHKDDHK